MKDNDKNYCDGILNTALYLERRNDGIILLDGVKYIYFCATTKEIIFSSRLSCGCYTLCNISEKQYPFGIFLSMDVFTQR